MGGGLTGLVVSFFFTVFWVAVALVPVRAVAARLALFAVHGGLSAWAITATAEAYGASDDLALTCAVICPGLLVVLVRLVRLVVGAIVSARS
ncbi:hypothetical protein [Actinosynnema sp. NPDC023587]|uniref:hypothetical protein n=1 Tax=Actinosynnema sp. NPDC023587 TaxID=3154695 RepID=UPI0033FCAAAE